ncbi:MAG: E3 binding domain-containing protein [Thermoplasmata archaeon]|nr:E3 binding domain-containing protein [Thermoplasmata archaeon]
MSDQPATVGELLKDAIAEGEELEALTAPEGVEATPKALLYARDFGVDISTVTGTGTEGKVTVPDVQKVKKEMDALAEAEATTVAADEPADEPKEEKPKKEKPKRKSQKAKRALVGERVNLLPSLRAGLDEIYHIVRSIHEVGSMGWDGPIVSAIDADNEIGKMLSDGWYLVQLQTLGVDMDGIHMLWVLGKPSEGYEDSFYPYREIHHITRPVGSSGDDGRGLVGVRANELITGYLRDGWDIAMAKGLGMGTGVVNMMWILVR